METETMTLHKKNKLAVVPSTNSAPPTGASENRPCLPVKSQFLKASLAKKMATKKMAKPKLVLQDMSSANPQQRRQGQSFVEAKPEPFGVARGS